MKVQYEFDLHLYKDQEKRLPDAVEVYNMAYRLKIVEFHKYATRWYFKVEGDFPKELLPDKIETFKMDTIFRLGIFMAGRND